MQFVRADGNGVGCTNLDSYTVRCSGSKYIQADRVSVDRIFANAGAAGKNSCDGVARDDVAFQVIIDAIQVGANCVPPSGVCQFDADVV